MADLRIVPKTAIFTTKERLESVKEHIMKWIDRKIAEQEKKATEHNPGTLNRSYIDGYLKGLNYARRNVVDKIDFELKLMRMDYEDN